MTQTNYGYSIAQHSWTKLEVKNAEFVRSCPTAAIPLGPGQMLIFGGASTKCFLLDTSTRNSNNEVKVEMAPTQLTTEAQFGMIEIHYASCSDQNYYAIDANRKYLYHLQINNLKWDCKHLREVGIET